MTKGLERLVNEYRSTMDADVVHSWARDLVNYLKDNGYVRREATMSRGSIPYSYRGEGNNDLG